MTHALLAAQSRLEIKVDTWRSHQTMDVAGIIRRSDYWGTADINIPVDGLIVDGKTPVAVLEFDRYYLVYTHYWHEVKTESHKVRILTNCVNHAMDMALQWITDNPQYREVRFTDDEIATFKADQMAEEVYRIRNRS